MGSGLVETTECWRVTAESSAREKVKRRRRDGVTIALMIATVAVTNVVHAQPRAAITAARVEQTTVGTRPAARVAESFDGLGYNFVGPQGTGRSRNPSDNSLAVGPDHVMQVVNGLGMAIFSRKGAKFDSTGRVLYGPVNVRNVFRGFTGNCEARSSGDAVVRYDQLAHRWLIVMPLFSRGPARADQPLAMRANEPAELSVIGVAGQPNGAAMLYQPPPPPTTDSVARVQTAAPTNATGATAPRAPADTGPYSMCYAVSTSEDPLGSYYRYEFLRADFPDYPRPAVWPDGYYVPTSSSDDRISATVATRKHACVVERERMLRGESAREQCVIIENSNFLNNADVDGIALPPRGAANIMLAAGGRQLDSLYEDHVIHAWSFRVDWQTPSRTRVTSLPTIAVAPYRYLCDGQLTACVPQPGSVRKLDSQGDKLMARVVYRRVNGHEAIVATHSINTGAGGGGVRWYEFRVTPSRALQLYQQGTYAPNGNFRWLPSPAMDKFGSIGIGYSFGGVNDFPGQRFAGRLANDPRGQLTLSETLLVAGEAPEGDVTRPGAQRWEDYAQSAVDPRDDCTIWYVGDYVKRGATSYSSRVGAFRMPGCGGR